MSFQKLKTYKYIALLIVVSISVSQNTFSQNTRTEILGAYIYNFAKLSSSPKQDKLKTYNITLISSNNEIIKEFQKIERNLKVNNKSITLTVVANAKINFQNSCLIFIATDKTAFYNTIYDKTKGLEVLLVSENYKDKRKILLNLYDSKSNKLLFEINKGNIYQRKITIDNKVLLLGGTEIDLVKLYLNSQNRLNKVEKTLIQTQNNLGELNKQITKTQEEVTYQKNEVEKKKELIKHEENKRQQLLSEINTFKIDLENQQNAVKESELALQVFYDSLENTKTLLQVQSDKLVKGEKTLEIQKNEILQQEKTLSKKDKTIDTQKNIVIAFIAVFLILLILAYLLFINLKEKKLRTKLLVKQKNEIIQKNQDLNTSLEDIKLMQQKLIEAEKMASLGVLSAGIAHEINNPINFVYAGINSLLRDFQDIEPVIEKISKIHPETKNLKEELINLEKLKEQNYFDESYAAIPSIISDIKLGADRTAEIVKGLRSFSRIEKNEYSYLDIHEGLDTSLLLLKNNYKTHVTIEKSYDFKIPQLYCFSGKLNQVFLNLISNAIDAIQNKGTIWITTKKINDKITISIKDSGQGISEKVKRKLFDPFFTTKEVGSGTGLGLSISYGIIKEHKGDIKVISELNKGSEFLITLPLK